MPLTSTSTTRKLDATGTAIDTLALTPGDPSSPRTQGVALRDEDQAHLGIEANPLWTIFASPQHVIVDSGAAITGYALETTQLVVQADLDYRFSGGKTAYSNSIASSGDHSIITPASGKRIQVYWIAFVPSSDNTAANLVKLGFGTTGGAISTELYRGYALAHWELFTGTANQSFIVNTATAETVGVVVHYKEIT